MSRGTTPAGRNFGFSARHNQSPQKAKTLAKARVLTPIHRQSSPTGKVEAAGIEPASRDLSTKASTCVAIALRSPERASSSRLAPQLVENLFSRERIRRDSRRSGFGD